MIRAMHARAVVEALAHAAESGPVFNALHECALRLDFTVGEEAGEVALDTPIRELEISIRLANALSVRNIDTVRQLVTFSAQDLLASSGKPSSTHYFGKKCLKFGLCFDEEAFCTEQLAFLNFARIIHV